MRFLLKIDVSRLSCCKTVDRGAELQCLQFTAEVLRNSTVLKSKSSLRESVAVEQEGLTCDGIIVTLTGFLTPAIQCCCCRERAKKPWLKWGEARLARRRDGNNDGDNTPI